MTPEEVVRRLWDRISARDWIGLEQLLAPDVEIYWPATLERGRGAANIVAVNAEYPEGWSIDVLSVLAVGDQVVSEVSVPMAGVGEFRSVAFWTVTGGRIVSGREYWTTVGGDPQPEWRAAYATVIDEPDGRR